MDWQRCGSAITSKVDSKKIDILKYGYLLGFL